MKDRPFEQAGTGEPTEEERAAVEQAWRRGEPLPPPWMIVELPPELVPSNPAGGRTFVMVKGFPGMSFREFLAMQSKEHPDPDAPPEDWAAWFMDERLSQE